MTEDTMPFTSQKAQELSDALRWIVKCGLPIEAFDAFLYEYRESGDIEQAKRFAAREWDLDLGSGNHGKE